MDQINLKNLKDFRLSFRESVWLGSCLIYSCLCPISLDRVHMYTRQFRDGKELGSALCSPEPPSLPGWLGGVLSPPRTSEDVGSSVCTSAILSPVAGVCVSLMVAWGFLQAKQSFLRWRTIFLKVLVMWEMLEWMLSYGLSLFLSFFKIYFL